MRFTPLTPGLLLGAVVMFGCADQTAPADDMPRATFNFTNGPGNPGPIVFNNQLGGIPGIALLNPDDQLLSTHSSDDGFEDLVAGCTPATESEVFDQHLVFPPSDPSELHYLLQTEDFVNVYDFTGLAFPDDFDCPLLTGETGRRLAVGRVLFVSQFNWDEDFTSGSGIWSANGTIDDLINGGTVAYHLKLRFKDDPFVPVDSKGPSLTPDPWN